MIIAAAIAAAAVPGVIVPKIVSGQHYVCWVQSITPSLRTAPAAQVVIEANDWVFDAALTELTRVPRASASVANGEMILSAPVPGEPGAVFKARVGQEIGDRRVILDWDAHIPEPNFSDVSSGIAVCNLSPWGVAQEKKS